MSASDVYLMKYAALIAKTGNGYSAHLPDLPGCIAATDTFEDARDLIREAAIFHVEGMVEDGDTILRPIYTAVEVEMEILASVRLRMGDRR